MEKLEMQNIETGERAPAHRIGTDEQGRAIYQRVNGWELVGKGLDTEIDTERDPDGNYHVAE